MGVLYHKNIEILGEYEVAVIGGGPAGVASAIAAARGGARVCLIEGMPCLGGMATSGLVGPFMTSFDRDGEERTVGGIFSEIVTRLEREGAAFLPDGIEAPNIYTSFIERYHRRVTPFDSFRLEIVLDRMTREAGVDVFCYTHFCDALCEDGTIRAAVLAAPEGLRAVRARVFIDATGIAALADAAGVPTYKGDEVGGVAQPATLMFEVAGADDERFEKSGKRPERPVKVYRTPTAGRYKVNHYHVYNVDAASAKSLTEAHASARVQVDEAMRVLRERTEGFENATFVQVAPVLGIRESRHIVGEYQITVEDVANGVKYADRIATYGFGMDIHSRNESEHGNFKIEVAKRYYVPYRALIPKGVSNLLVAGKTISATSQAVGGMRCMPAAMAMGEAAGVAATLALSHGGEVRSISVEALQQRLRAAGAILD